MLYASLGGEAAGELLKVFGGDVMGVASGEPSLFSQRTASIGEDILIRSANRRDFTHLLLDVRYFVFILAPRKLEEARSKTFYPLSCLSQVGKPAIFASSCTSILGDI